MLELNKISKEYIMPGSVVKALNSVNIKFRDNEFVSILGPSGCGKTTLLNIIGGLDKYTDGDLIIDGISTKEYSDKDWDSYRNHRIGFIFQSYNLIPHQTILENVELALTISGIEKTERVKRAKEALDKVGLGGQYNKKPNQLSGGQCQRVAIARALVNEPEILLADEPTGALDTTTSVQIMELIRQIAKDRLVIMVTHNPELAEKYSTRIIKLLDGNIVSDTYPATEPSEKNSHKQVDKKSKLSVFTAFKLSLRNLISKMSRTFLVSLAGSIGIIGVAMVIAVSAGVQGYIRSMQNDMLSGNPVTISEEGFNLNSLISSRSMSDNGEAVIKNIEDGYVNVNNTIDYIMSRTKELSSLRIKNNINQNYIDYINAMPAEYYNAIVYDYSIDMSNNIYTLYNLENKPDSLISISSAKQIYSSMLTKTEYKDMTSMIQSFTGALYQLPDSPDFILSQYDFITGKTKSKFPSSEDEVLLVVNKDQELSDLLLAELGYYSQQQFLNVVYKSAESEKYDSAIEKTKFSYDELLDKKFIWYPNNTVYNKNTTGNTSVNPFTYNYTADSSWTNGKTFKITGIVKPKEDLSYGTLNSGLYYTESFVNHVLKNSLESQIVNFLKENEQSAISSGKVMGNNTGITYEYNYFIEGTEYNETGFVGSISQMASMMGMMGGSSGSLYTLTLRNLGGNDLPEKISIYPVDFESKDYVTAYLDKWNSDESIEVNDQTLTPDDRSEIIYNDNLSIIIDMINTMINIITTALIAFTALSLVVSTFMIAIITNVSVLERIKEIGIIRSLGGRKGDVANLFIAETFIIGLSSGVIGIGVTYFLSFVINIIVNNLISFKTICALPVKSALIIIIINILLTTISGLIPAQSAAKKDPVVALRTE